MNICFYTFQCHGKLHDENACTVYDSIQYILWEPKRRCNRHYKWWILFQFDCRWGGEQKRCRPDSGASSLTTFQRPSSSRSERRAARTARRGGEMMESSSLSNSCRSADNKQQLTSAQLICWNIWSSNTDRRRGKTRCKLVNLCFKSRLMNNYFRNRNRLI